MKRGLSQNLSRIMSAELSKYDAVVITGASSGIGRALAGLVLSLCDVKLCNISRNIPDDFKDRENFLHVPCDLKNPDEIDSAFQKVLEHIDIYKEKQRYPKILLVNNSGFGAYGEFPEPDIRQNCEMIDVNVRALTKLCGLFMPLIKKGGGSIVNIASTAAFQPCPQLSAYAAGKSYVLSFSLALSYELKKYGAKCLCVCPGPTSSNFFKNAGFDEPPLPGSFGHQPQDVAVAALKALAKGKRLKIVGFINNIQALLVKFLPVGLVLAVSGAVLSKVRSK